MGKPANPPVRRVLTCDGAGCAVFFGPFARGGRQSRQSPNEISVNTLAARHGKVSPAPHIGPCVIAIAPVKGG